MAKKTSAKTVATTKAIATTKAATKTIAKPTTKVSKTKATIAKPKTTIAKPMASNNKKAPVATKTRVDSGIKSAAKTHIAANKKAAAPKAKKA